MDNATRKQIGNGNKLSHGPRKIQQQICKVPLNISIEFVYMPNTKPSN
jgi:hypothetical protein